MAVGTASPALPVPISYPSTPFSPHSRPKSINAFAKRSSLRQIASSSVKAEPELSSTEPEAALLEALLGIQGRGRAASPQQLMEVEQAVLALEDLKGVPEPTSSGLIEGRWQLVFTTRPGTASPIQRTFVGVDYFKILQEVSLRTNDPRVSNIIKFSDAIGELKVEAAATIEDGKRILFRFDRAAFAFKFLPFKVPYPVPFRLLGDEAKGWLDTTYLSVTGNIRISRGNKGTTFVLQKKTEPRQRLLSAISVGSGVTEVIEEIVSLNQYKCSGDLKNLEGKWQLLWTSQVEDESWQNIAAYGLKGFQIVKENGQLENQVDFFPGFRLHVNGKLMQVPNSNLYNVTMTDAVGLVGTINFPLDISRKFETELLKKAHGGASWSVQGVCKERACSVLRRIQKTKAL